MPHKIFTIKEGKLLINDELMLGNKKVREVLEQSNTSTKFNSGGTRAIQELMFIYYVADFDSPFVRNGYPESEAFMKAKEKIGLPLTWAPNKILTEAIEEYREHQSSVSRDTIIELLKAFRLHKEIVTKVTASLRDSLRASKITRSEASEATNMIGYLMELSKELPKTVRDLKKAIKELETEDSIEHDLLRGTDEAVPESADPTLD